MDLSFLRSDCHESKEFNIEEHVHNKNKYKKKIYILGQNGLGLVRKLFRLEPKMCFKTTCAI